MNKQSKQNRALAHKSKRKQNEVSVLIPYWAADTMKLSWRTQVIATHACPRKSPKDKPKVAATKNENGPSLIDQHKIFNGPWSNL